MLLNRSSHQTYSIKKGVLRNFAKFTWKYLCQGLFLIKMQVLGLKPATLLKKRLLHKGFPANFAKFLRTPFLQNTSGWLLLTKLHDPNRRKMRLPCFELRWLLNGMNMPWHSVFSFSFFFLFRNNVIREQLGENDFRRCYVSFPEVWFWKYLITAMFKVLYQQLRGNLTTEFERHLTTEYFMDIGVELPPRHLTYYCMLLFLSNKPSF